MYILATVKIICPVRTRANFKKKIGQPRHRIMLANTTTQHAQILFPMTRRLR